MLSRRIDLRSVSHAVIGFAALLACSIAAADPPSRVARLANIDGAVSFSPAGEDEWVYATPNRPLITGDRVWADAGARAELQIGSLAVRLGSQTSVTILNLDDRVAQFQLAQGALNVRVRRLDPDQTIEVDTPLLAFSLRRPGDYRIDVDPVSAATTVAVRSGEGVAYGEGAAYTIGARQWYRFADSGLRDYEYDALPPADTFDTWTRERDRREDHPVAARYVSPEVIGYADLDDYGTWSVVEGYGNVWVPTSVARDWAPYRHGHWAWIEPWGWTWVDDAPWGFAPFHYGRWAYARERWCWVPGPLRVRPVYAPALVAFVGGNNFTISVSSGEPARGIAWFPLAPGEVYRPAYRVSRNYFTNVNVSNTNVSNTYVTNIYNRPDAPNTVYRNREQRGGMTAVPAAVFVQSRPVAQSAVVVSRNVVAAAPVTGVAAIAPVRASVIGGGAGAAAAGAASAARPAPGTVGRPPTATIQRPVFARVAPPPPPAPFNVRESTLAKDPGRPADPATAVAARPAATGAPTAPPVKVVAPTTPGTPPPAPTIARPRTNAPPTAPGSAPAAAGGTATGIAPRQGAPVPVPQPPGASPPVPPRPPSSLDAGGPVPKTGISPPPAPPAGVRAPPPPPQAAPSAQPPPPPRAMETRPVPQPPPAVAQPPVAPAPGPAELRREPPPPPKPPVAPPPPPAELRREQPPAAAPAAVRPPPAPPPTELRREQPAAAAPAAVKPPPTPPPAELRREPPPTVAKPPVAPPPAAVPAAPATVRQAEPKAKAEPAKGEAPKAKSEEKRDDQK